MKTITVTPTPNTTLPVCHIFVDSSNVTCREANVPGLSAIARRGFGSVNTAAVVGTTAAPSDREKLWANLGYDATFTVRAPGQPESHYNVDATIVSWIYRAMRQYDNQRSTIVLVTGDGNANDGSPNFAEVVRHALQDDWNVKLVCLNAAAVYYALQREFPKSLVIERITQAMITAATANPVGASVGPPKAQANGVPPAGKQPSPTRPATSGCSASSGIVELAVVPVEKKPKANVAVAGGGLAEMPPCKFFAAGFCKFGAACKFSHSVAQPPKAPQSARERVVPPPVIPSPALAFAPAASSPAQPPPHRQRPSLAAAPEANVAAPVVVAGPRAAATIQASQSDVLCRMVDLALSSGCMSFSASVGSGQATFIRR